MKSEAFQERLGEVDWERAEAELDGQGNAVLGSFLGREECHRLASLYGSSELFRNRVIMERHGFGRGEYQYFAYPLPETVAAMRTAFYPHLVPIANRWNRLMKVAIEYPPEHEGFLERCRAAGQDRPTPLLLQYGEGDYNCLHRDLYGEHFFPLQVVILLSDPRTFQGGEFLLVEQVPRGQPRPMVVPLRQGDAVVFATDQRPKVGAKGLVYRVGMRHGVSRVLLGQRHTLGIVFHDASSQTENR